MRYLTPIFALIFLLSVTTTAQSNLQDKLVNKWKIETLKEFGKKYDLKEREGDHFHFKEDNTFKGDYEGKPIKGSWKTQNNQWLLLTPDNRDNLKLKIIKLKKNKMILEYQDPESLVRTKLIYVPK